MNPETGLVIGPDSGSSVPLALGLLALALLTWPDPARQPGISRGLGSLRGSGGLIRREPGSGSGVDESLRDPTAIQAVRAGSRRAKFEAGDGAATGRVAAFVRGTSGPVVLGLVGEWASGPSVGVAVALLAATLGRVTRAGLTRGRRRRALLEVLACVRTLGRELQAGAAPVAAVRAAAAGHPGPGARTMGAVLAAVTVDDPSTDRFQDASESKGRPPSGSDGRLPTESDVIARLTAGWRLSSRHGVPWAALVGATAADLAEASRADGAAQAQLAGTRMSGWVLSVLPALGLALGAGMGADPLHVLFGTRIGGVLLLAGVTLTCAGLLWTARIAAG